MVMAWAGLGWAREGEGVEGRVSIDPGGEVASNLEQSRARDSGGHG